MLFRGDDALVVSDAAQKAAALANGWHTRWLPCDGPRPELVDAAPAKAPAHVGPESATPAPKTTKGRAAKE
jgi:hypothetical protein